MLQQPKEMGFSSPPQFTYNGSTSALASVICYAVAAAVCSVWGTGMAAFG